MLEILQFCLSDFWHFVGAAILLSIVVQGFVKIAFLIVVTKKHKS